MKKFKFRLQRVLQHKSSVVEERKRELVARNIKLRDAHKELERLEQSFTDNTVAQEAILAVENFYLAGQYLERLRSDIARQRIVIDRADEDMKDALKGYLEAKRDEQALLKLKDRKLQQFKDKVEKEIQNLTDEMVTQRIGLERSLKRDESDLDGSV